MQIFNYLVLKLSNAQQLQKIEVILIFFFFLKIYTKKKIQ